AFLELALQAAERCGAKAVAELTLQAPLPLPEQGAVQLQVNVSGQDEDGNREISIHSRPQGDGEDGVEWTTHATGTLSTEAKAQPEPLTTWPPEGAEPIGLDDVYEQLAEAGLEYGPAFQGLTAAWRVGEEIYAEVALAEGQREEAGRFGIHPALLDSALHAAALGASDQDQEGGVGLPFSWSEVSLDATGAGEMRVVLRRQGQAVSLQLADSSGAPLARVGSLDTRSPSAGQLQGAKRGSGSIFAIDWAHVDLAADPSSNGIAYRIATLGELKLDGAERYPGLDELTAAIAAGQAPEAVLFEPEPKAAGQPAEEALEATGKALELLQEWLTLESLSSTHLAFVTQGAFTTDQSQAPQLPGATLWGLVRSAQSEHPGRFALIDTDGTDASTELLPAAAIDPNEPQLALRDGAALAPRLARLDPSNDAEGQIALDGDGTVLITGASGGLGAPVARHLATSHGARHLLLASRSGSEAEGASELKAELTELGVEVTIAACDVSDREALATLIDSIPTEHPLGAVIHAAGVIDDGLVASMDQGQLQRIFAPKADAAWNLHELTRELPLSAFVLFSSAAATFGSPGQANYAAANSFLDALAQRRRYEGLPATSIAWGLWAVESGMSSQLSEGDLARMERAGMGALAEEEGLAMLDSAVAAGRPFALAARIDPRGMRAQAQAGLVPPLLRGLVRVPRARAATGPSLLSRLDAAAEDEREGMVLDLVRAEVAAVLGHESADAIDPAKAFQDLGFDSLAAVELRNRLVVATGLELPATLAFDYPTSAELAGYVLFEAPARDGAVGLVSLLGGPASGPAGDAEHATQLLLSQAASQDQAREFFHLLMAVAPFRPSFDNEDPDSAWSPVPAPLSSGSTGPVLVCMATATHASGVHEYAAFAKEFEGRREVVAIPQAGFAPQEPVPKSLSVAVEAHAEAIGRLVADRPFILVGHSTGGGYAHSVAKHMEDAGLPPSGVVAIDTYRMDLEGGTDGGDAVLRALLADVNENGPIATARLTAMGAHVRLLSEWDWPEISAPTLLLRATEQLPGTSSESDWQSSWGLSHRVDVPGNHFTMMREHAGTTVRALDEWLAAISDNGSAGAVGPVEHQRKV
ncbi:MAG TPA: SDR family NAD(P)-dependent oxidoreductase, partial [Solirubrobacterales bacterium]